MKWLVGLLLIGSLLGNAAGFWVVKKLYTDVNAVRLDPLQLSVYPEQPPKQAQAEPRVVLFGDSRILSWPLPSLDSVELLNRGIGQQTSAQIELRYSAHVQPLQPDLVVLQLCVNDLKTIPLLPQRQASIIEQCKNNLDAIIQQARTQGSEVLVTTIFPLGKVPLSRKLLWSDAVAASIREVNSYIQNLSAQEGVHVLDTFSLLQGEPDLIRPAYSRDLLHLNAQGYEVLNQALTEWLVAKGS